LTQNKIATFEKGTFDCVTKLVSLNVSHNQISEFSCFFGLKNILELVLNHNSISKIIFSEDMLCQLKKLDVGYNRFSQIRLDNFHVNSKAVTILNF
jgi:Leucine-rich repeat (LRR) protein